MPITGGRQGQDAVSNTRWHEACQEVQGGETPTADTVVVDATFAEGTADVKDETERSGQRRILRGEETCTEPQLKPGGEGRGEGRGEDNWWEGQDR